MKTTEVNVETQYESLLSLSTPRNLVRICFHQRSQRYEFRFEEQIGNHITPRSGWIKGDSNLEMTKHMASDRAINKKIEFTVE